MSTLRPFTESEYLAWRDETIPAYATDKVASGAWSAEESLEKSRAEFEALLPDGKDTTDNRLFAVLSEDGTRVGMLWFAVKARADRKIAYVYNIEIDAPYRRLGHAQRALGALEREAQRLGLGGIALHVFGHNTSAHALYVKLGFLATNINMFKPVAAAGA